MLLVFILTITIIFITLKVNSYVTTHHKMQIKPEYYALIKSNQKTIIQLLKNKSYKPIEFGHELKLVNDDDKKDFLRTTIIQTYHAPNFEKLFEIIDVNKTGFTDKKQILKNLSDFYDIEEQEKYGVVAIEFKNIFNN